MKTMTKNYGFTDKEMHFLPRKAVSQEKVNVWREVGVGLLVLAVVFILSYLYFMIVAII